MEYNIQQWFGWQDESLLHYRTTQYIIVPRVDSREFILLHFDNVWHLLAFQTSQPIKEPHVQFIDTWLLWCLPPKFTGLKPGFHMSGKSQTIAFVDFVISRPSQTSPTQGDNGRHLPRRVFISRECLRRSGNNKMIPMVLDFPVIWIRKSMQNVVIYCATFNGFKPSLYY